MSSLLSSVELSDWLPRIARMQGRLLARTRSLPGEEMIAQASRTRTRERLGTRKYRPGDPVSNLSIKALMIRDALVVRQYARTSETVAICLMDCSRTLLDDEQTGPFAQLAALVWQLSAAAARHSIALARMETAVGDICGGKGRRGVSTIVEHLGSLPRSAVNSPLIGRLNASLPRRRGNCTALVLLHAGYPIEVLKEVAEILRARTVAARVLLCANIDEYSLATPLVRHSETGSVSLLPAHTLSPSYMNDYFEQCERIGQHLGVSIEPLIIADWQRDLELMLPYLMRAL